MEKKSIDIDNELTEKAQSFYLFKTEYLNRLKCNSHIERNRQKIISTFSVTEKEWFDWKWQMHSRVNTIEQLSKIFKISEDEIQKISSVSEIYRWSVTPYYLSLIEKFSYTNPIVLQSIPHISELVKWGTTDPMKEIQMNPAGTITRRYPDRVIINTTNCCATFCRHCQRRRNIGQEDKGITSQQWQDSLNYIKSHPEIRDVLITGGDPFTTSDQNIDLMLTQLRKIPTIDIIRIGTRTLVTLPSRITSSLVDIIKKHAPIYINTQFNHPIEVTNEAQEACLKLSQNGAVLGNQMVFLNNINNDAFTVQILNQLLLKCGVKPYYIFHPKKVIGTKQFSISIKEGLKIIDELSGYTSGLAIPFYVYNADNGLGKIRLNKNMLNEASSEGCISLRTWNGQELIINLLDKY